MLDSDQDQDQEFPVRRCRSRCPQPRRRATVHFLPPRPTGQEGSSTTAGTGGPDMDDLYEDLLDDIRDIIREEVAEVAYIAMVSMSLPPKPLTPNPNPIKETQP